MGKVLSSGGSKKMSISVDGFMIELMIVPDKNWGAAMFHCTGPARYNVRNREIAKGLGMSLSQNGLIDSSTGLCVASKTEEEICEKLGIPWIDPQLRDEFEKHEKSVVVF